MYLIARRIKRPQLLLALAIALLFGAAGTWLLTSSHADSPASTPINSANTSTTTATAGCTQLPRVSGKSVPACGVLMGTSSVDPANVNDSDFKAEYAARETLAGRTFDIDNHFPGWLLINADTRTSWDIQNGRIPMISWGHGSGNLSFYTDGGQDAFIKQQADLMRDTHAPIMLRFLWEMNGNSTPWTGSNNNDQGQTNGPAKYIAAWRHVHDIFAAEGATNVIWVWCPQSVDTPAVAWNHWTNYYPGDAYVDWVSLDAYSYGTQNPSHGGWQELAPQLQGIYNDYSKTKPIIISETSSSENAPPGDSKASWIGRVASDIQTKFPDISAVVWFDHTIDGDFPFDTSASSLTAFRNWLAAPYYNPLNRPDTYATAVSAPAAPPQAPTSPTPTATSTPSTPAATKTPTTTKSASSSSVAATTNASTATKPTTVAGKAVTVVKSDAGTNFAIQLPSAATNIEVDGKPTSTIKSTQLTNGVHLITATDATTGNKITEKFSVHNSFWRATANRIKAQPPVLHYVSLFVIVIAFGIIFRTSLLHPWRHSKRQTAPIPLITGPVSPFASLQQPLTISPAPETAVQVALATPPSTQVVAAAVPQPFSSPTFVAPGTIIAPSESKKL